MATVIELSANCPECGERMYIRIDPRARKIVSTTPKALLHTIDFDELGCEPDHHWCKTCGETRDTYESAG